MNKIKQKLLALKNIIIQYRNNYKHNKETIESFLNSDLPESYIEKCNHMLIDGHFIDKPLNEEGLKLYILRHEGYLFSENEKIEIIKKLITKSSIRKKGLIMQKS